MYSRIDPKVKDVASTDLAQGVLVLTERVDGQYSWRLEKRDGTTQFPVFGSFYGMPRIAIGQALHEIKIPFDQLDAIVKELEP